jgi:hypothetical protein
MGVALMAIFNLVGVDSPLLCGEEDELQSESLGSGADAASIPRPLAAGSVDCDASHEIGKRTCKRSNVLSLLALLLSNPLDVAQRLLITTLVPSQFA